MDISAKARFIRMSPRKVRLVIDTIRGLNIAEAKARLSLMKQLAAKPVLKLLRSAQANAEHNFKLSPEILFIKTVTADGGPVFKRWTPKAFGRANQIRHRTSHISLTLSEKIADQKEIKSKKSKVTKKNS
ncbi:MAG: 50S ribosomal protein L22 [Candidatus Uhrbacteria bacterium]